MRVGLHQDEYVQRTDFILSSGSPLREEPEQQVGGVRALQTPHRRILVTNEDQVNGSNLSESRKERINGFHGNPMSVWLHQDENVQRTGFIPSSGSPLREEPEQQGLRTKAGYNQWLLFGVGDLSYCIISIIGHKKIACTVYG
jgi:hypothetical protein